MPEPCVNMESFYRILLVAVFASLTSARTTTTQNPPSPQLYQIPPQQEAQPTQDSYYPQILATFDPVNSGVPQNPYQLPTNLQLPRSESSNVPFYAPDLSTVMKAPQYNPEPDYYAVPIPAQDLIAPIETAWNPNNDPKLFYEVPAVLTKQEVPTNSHPKKFSKDVHSKVKPFSRLPKQEITLQPIYEKQYLQKQKGLTKAYDKLAKLENQKQLDQKPQQQQQVYRQDSNKNLEPQPAASGFYDGFNSEGVSSSKGQGFTQGLSADLTASLGITSPHHGGSSGGERINFHMVGHDGPKSYKWGYDTGKGHDRQFRYEERDKEGVVKGHFGFYDKHGKLQMVHYDAQPHDGGYHAEGNFGKY